MNALKTFCKAGLLLAVCCSAGCFGAASSTYVAKDVDVRGKPSKFEHRQKARSVEEAIARMLTDPTFDESYREVAELAKAAGRKKPVLAIKPIQNNTGDGKSDSAATHQIFKSLQTSLRKTGKFEIVDYTQRQALIKTVIDGNKCQYRSIFLHPDTATVRCDVCIGAVVHLRTGDHWTEQYGSEGCAV